jgi:two-component system chemotaxis response regulator CheY
MKILVVDDSASMREMIAFTLTEQGHEVIQAKDGRAGTELLGPEIKLVITDLYMPVMDGISFIEAVRASPTNRFTPIIMLTTESEAGKQAEARKAGVTAWLVKPFSPEKLLETIKRVIP